MNIRNLLAITLLFGSIYACQKADTKNDVLHVDFDSSTIGAYDEVNLTSDFDSITWSILKGRGMIIAEKDKGQVLRVAFPKDAVGPEEGGVQFVRPIAPATEYYLSYDLYFEDGFDFVKGGKLPGLTSGGSKYTGGVHPGNGEGWSARYMWIGGGKAVAYLYHVDMKEKYGDAVPLSITFQTGKWYTITQHIKLNSGDEANAVLEVWVNGEKVGTKENFRLRKGNQGLIDTFYFSTFHGGASPDWAPANDSFIRFDDVVVSSEPIIER